MQGKTRWGFWRESFLNELPAINPNDFVEPVDNIRHDFVPMGFMNDFEKAAYTWLHRNESLLAELDRRIGEIYNVRYKDLAKCELDPETASLCSEFSILQAKVETVKKALRLSVQDRFKIPYHFGIFLTRGFQVCVPRADFGKNPLLVKMNIFFQMRQEEQDFFGEEVPPPYKRH